MVTLQQELLQSVVQLNHDMASRTVGEYNIFSVLGIQGKEVLACGFLADLMNPRGQHGQGAAFFLMMSIIGCQVQIDFYKLYEFFITCILIPVYSA